eukprot:TRINITY_DN4000_c0_g1_i1.p1 TRINITY_DN4000_c0_g1~~TRINITY_DN4000_c0_g1_i1.p1  ORF type:complete len:163 (+),score=26.99 TRINITY_DN4000_c0_g1_i1:39-491(+)
MNLIYRSPQAIQTSDVALFPQLLFHVITFHLVFISTYCPSILSPLFFSFIIPQGTYRQVNPKTPLCKVYCTNGDEFIFYCGGTGYLIEFNERVLQDPTLLIRKPATEGFLALVLPKRGDEDASITGLMTEEAYCALRGVNIQRESLLTPS